MGAFPAGQVASQVDRAVSPAADRGDSEAAVVPASPEGRAVSPEDKVREGFLEVRGQAAFRAEVRAPAGRGASEGPAVVSDRAEQALRPRPHP